MVHMATNKGRGEVGPGAGVHQRLRVKPVDGVRNPVVQVENVLDGDVGSAPARAASF
jgi:hypothetical protein